MADVQLFGPVGSEVNLRDPASYLLVADGFQPLDPHIEVQLQTVPAGTVVVSRYDTNYKELKATLLIRGATRVVRKGYLRSLEAVIAQAVLYTTSQGRQGTAAYYSEQWGDEPTPDVYPFKVGYVKEKSRQLFWQQIECELYLLLEPQL